MRLAPIDSSGSLQTFADDTDKPTTSSNFDIIPDEMLMKILGNLTDPKDLSNAELVSKRFQTYAWCAIKVIGFKWEGNHLECTIGKDKQKFFTLDDAQLRKYFRGIWMRLRDVTEVHFYAPEFSLGRRDRELTDFLLLFNNCSSEFKHKVAALHFERTVWQSPAVADILHIYSSQVRAIYLNFSSVQDSSDEDSSDEDSSNEDHSTAFGDPFYTFLRILDVLPTCKGLSEFGIQYSWQLYHFSALFDALSDLKCLNYLTFALLPEEHFQSCADLLLLLRRIKRESGRLGESFRLGFRTHDSQTITTFLGLISSRDFGPISEELTLHSSSLNGFDFKILAPDVPLFKVKVQASEDRDVSEFVVRFLREYGSLEGEKRVELQLEQRNTEEIREELRNLERDVKNALKDIQINLEIPDDDDLLKNTKATFKKGSATCTVLVIQKLDLQNY